MSISRHVKCEAQNRRLLLSHGLNPAQIFSCQVFPAHASCEAVFQVHEQRLQQHPDLHTLPRARFGFVDRLLASPLFPAGRTLAGTAAGIPPWSWSPSTIEQAGSKALTKKAAALEPGSLSTSVCVTRTDMMYLEHFDKSRSAQVRLMIMTGHFNHVCFGHLDVRAPPIHWRVECGCNACGKV